MVSGVPSLATDGAISYSSAYNTPMHQLFLIMSSQSKSNRFTNQRIKWIKTPSDGEFYERQVDTAHINRRGVGTRGLDEATALDGYTLIAPLTGKTVRVWLSIHV